MLRYFALFLPLLFGACLGCRSAQAKQNHPSPPLPAQTAMNADNTPPAKATIAPQDQQPETKRDNEPKIRQAPLIFDETDAVPPAPPITITRPFINPYEAKIFFDHQADEHKKFGIPRYAKHQRKKKYGNSVLMQRSGRKRLYDHNIFLRALLSGKIHSALYGDLGEQFRGGIFFDIGSAILFGEGAETVRDLFEDTMIRENLTIIASDINNPSDKKNRFIDIYRQSQNELPFPVVEIPRLIEKPEHFTKPIKLFLNNKTGIILRSANSGPDLYYNSREVQRHLQSALAAFAERSVIYLFNKFILYKPANKGEFLLIGEIDENVGINHKKATWKKINWSKRTFAEAIRLNGQHVFYREKEITPSMAVNP